MSRQDEVTGARRRLGRQLAAWRVKAGLTQRDLGHRTGYSRSTIAHAEVGDRASRDLVQAADQALGAGGRLAAAHDTITAAAAAARSQAARRARAQAAAATAGDWPPLPVPVVSAAESTCPSCDRRLAVRVVVLLLPAVPATGP